MSHVDHLFLPWMTYFKNIDHFKNKEPDLDTLSRKLKSTLNSFPQLQTKLQVNKAKFRVNVVENKQIGLCWELFCYEPTIPGTFWLYASFQFLVI